MKKLIPILAAALLPAAVFADDPTPVKLSTVSRSIFFRDGKGTRGNAGFNSGRYSQDAFNGNFEDYMQQNTAGAELVIPTTDATTGEAWYVTEFKVGHAGNTKYSLYYTTDPEPSGILSNAKDPRHWDPIDAATDIQAGGTKTYPVNKVATAVKYMFDTVIGWTPSLGEVEVWGIDPAELGCLHPDEYLTEWTAIPGTANCTDFGIDQRQCTNCGEYFQRQSPTEHPLGHNYETVLVERGTGLAFGSGTNVCKRCGEEIAFPAPRDLMAMGGLAMPGIVQFTDVSVSSTGNEDWGVRPNLLFDDDWTMGWTKYWYANTKSVDEYAQWDFATAVDLTAVDVSVPNRSQTLRFYSVEAGEEVLVGEHAVEYDSSIPSGNDNYQRFTVEFRGVALKTLRVKSDDADNAFTICELHPWGTVSGAGKTAAVRTRIILD